MTIREALDTIKGFRYCFEKMPFATGTARSLLLEMTIPHDEDSINSQYDALAYFANLKEDKRQLLIHYLYGIHDISQTLTGIIQGRCADDIELFEIKHLSYIAKKVYELLDGLYVQNIETCNRTFSILDPIHSGQDSFYVYDCYSESLRKARKNGDIEAGIEEEKKVLETLTGKIRTYAENLKETLSSLLRIDIAQAKAEFHKNWQTCKPSFSDKGELVIEGMVNPLIRDTIGTEKYQPVSIRIVKGTPYILTGMNMGGKSVTLNTVCLVQVLAQIGMGCPAKNAELGICEDIYYYNSETSKKEIQLSSFASEMKCLDLIITGLNNTKGDNLIIIDEPARTTNPIEGEALVYGLIESLKNPLSYMLIATHYNVNDCNCKYLRVKGMTENGGIDYSIKEVERVDVPNEALSVARLMNVSGKWIELSEKYLSNAK